jgi:hypothetical protein
MIRRVSGTSDLRFTATFGLVSTALNTAALACFSLPPRVETAAHAEILDWLADHRVRVLAAVVLATLGWTASLAFLAGLRSVIRQATGPNVALDAGLLAAAALFAVVGVGYATVGSAAFMAGSRSGLSADLAHLAVSTLFVALAVSAGPTLLLAGTFGLVIVRQRPLPVWMGWGLLVVGAVHIGAAVALSEGGAFGPEGVFANAAPVLFEAWQALTALGIWRLASRHAAGGSDSTVDGARMVA